jgi:ketosteroid isomerase-like protein
MRKGVMMMFALAMATIGAAEARAQKEPTIDPALMAAQQKFHDLQKSCNAAEIGHLVTDDMMFLHADGRLEDKAAFTKFVSACQLSDIRLNVKSARMYGDFAVLQGDLPFTIKNGPSMNFAVTQVWLKRQGKWLFASHQSTDAKSFIASMSASKK